MGGEKEVKEADDTFAGGEETDDKTKEYGQFSTQTGQRAEMFLNFNEVEDEGDISDIEDLFGDIQGKEVYTDVKGRERRYIPIHGRSDVGVENMSFNLVDLVLKNFATSLHFSEYNKITGNMLNKNGKIINLLLMVIAIRFTSNFLKI